MELLPVAVVDATPVRLSDGELVEVGEAITVDELPIDCDSDLGVLSPPNTAKWPKESGGGPMFLINNVCVGPCVNCFLEESERTTLSSEELWVALQVLPS